MEIVGINSENIKKISDHKKEAEWIRQYRLDSYKFFNELPMPEFGPKYDLDFNKIIYYKSNDNDMKSDWNKIDKNIKNEFDDLGVIKGECNLDGIGVQYESEVIYHNMIEEAKEKNVIFTSIEVAMKEYPELVKKYFGKIVKNNENKFAALNSSVFSGGSFIYIPPNTTLDRPLHSYFRINSKGMGQFERTLIIVDDNSSVHYVEGCTAPTYSDSSLHAAVVEIYVGKNSKCRYSTVQNWSTDVLNLVTKRALVDTNGIMEWIDGNIGSKVTMKYPACVLKGDNASGTCITISVADSFQQQDSGARMIHVGKNTKSNIISKSISKNGGKCTYRSLVRISENASNSKSSVSCESLMLDDISVSDTIPVNDIRNDDVEFSHEAKIGKISDKAIFYLMSRGFSEEDAKGMIVRGFADSVSKELPIEYAVEMNNLINLELEGSIG